MSLLIYVCGYIDFNVDFFSLLDIIKPLQKLLRPISREQALPPRTRAFLLILRNKESLTNYPSTYLSNSSPFLLDPTARVCVCVCVLCFKACVTFSLSPNCNDDFNIFLQFYHV